MVEELVSNRGIPKMDVVEDVAAFLKREGDISAEEGVKRMEESYKKYKYVEQDMIQQKIKMSEKLPEFEASLKMINVLIEKRDKNEKIETTYLLAEEVYTKAVVNDPSKVCIWLGANVMVEFELEKAKEFMEKNSNKISQVVSELDNELAFMKDQITTTEVNLAHIHNHGVKARAGGKA